MNKIRFLVFATVLLLCATTGLLAANPPLPKAQAPVYTTSFGQSPDSNFVNVLSKRANLNNYHKTVAVPQGAEWNNAKTFIAVIGGSSKGLGSAGLAVSDEIKRCESFIKAARAQNKYIIGMHIGGKDRRGPTSADFIPFAGQVDYMIVRSEGNEDGYFTKLCGEKGIPLYIIENTREIEGVLKEIFGL